MILASTIVDDMDLGIAPVNYRADPVKRSAVGRGLLGQVHFVWPFATERIKTLTLFYEQLQPEQARRLVTVFGKPVGMNRTLRFTFHGPEFWIPGKVTLRLNWNDGLCDVTIETIARRFGQHDIGFATGQLG